MARAPAPFSLDEALSGWTLPLAALAPVVVVGALHLLGLASERLTSTVVVLAVAAGTALYVLRPALDGRRPGATRALALLAALLVLSAVALPSLATVHPGTPLFAGELEKVSDALAIPATVSGRVRLLVSGQLAEQGEPAVTYTLTGTEEPLEGRLERTFSYARVGRSGRARVAHDRTGDMFTARIPAGAAALTLDRMQGRAVGPLHVAVYRDPIPVPGGAWILALLATALAAAVDARLARKNELGVAAGMAVAFALLVTYNATPSASVGPTVGGIVLGAILGSLAGWLVELLVRRFVPPEKRPVPERAGAVVK